MRPHTVDELFVSKAARRLKVESNYVYVISSLSVIDCVLNDAPRYRSASAVLLQLVPFAPYPRVALLSH